MAMIGLYYPWMHFQDPAWLKLAVLTWDRLVRVRPPGIDDRDTRLVRQLRDGSDLVMDAAPGAKDLSALHELFADLVESHLRELQARYDVWRRDSDDHELPGVAWPQSQAPAFQPVPELSWVFYGESRVGVGHKMDASLLALLRDCNLAMLHHQLPGWVGMAPRMAEAYLVTLADVMARANNLSPVTDDPRVHRALGSAERLAEMLLGYPTRPDGAVNDPAGAYIELSLRAVLQPDRLAKVPIAKLLKFRERHAAELAAFRTHVAGLGTELTQVAAVADVDLAHAHLMSLYETKTRPALEELRRGLRGFGIKSSIGVMTLKADLGVGTTLGAAATVAGHPLVGGAALALATVPYAVSRLSAWRRRRTDSPVAYLLSAARELAVR